ncbi:DUF58 domain-containing protein [Sungkyunkwania multivorans]|uniref:DUF58 domain-containing protein n=1 Tax=Sungkyunkwania multivorans TaxID=1173618 RepID=A0ABW3CT64_9FLAO
MLKLIKSFYIQPRFFYAGMAVVVLFVLSFFAPPLFRTTKLIFAGLFFLLLIDALLLYFVRGKYGVEGARFAPERFSNGDDNGLKISLKNNYPFLIRAEVIDELPYQFQIRDFKRKKSLKPQSETTISYTLRPTERGEYRFGKLNIYAQTQLGFIARRFTIEADQMVPTYPSFLQLRKYELMTIGHHLQDYGVKKTRRIGHTMEFEQIKEYVQGDDLRTINWKATAKKNELMVNQYQDEKSQPIYSVIDKGRIMQMPFNGLSLLDYAINATLIISSVVLRKQDRAGLFSFSKKVENYVAAERRSGQMGKILHALYNVQTDFLESDYSRLYAEIKRNITHRSLILLYSNFETLDALNRQLPYLKAIAKSHLLVVIFFKNTELDELLNNKATTIQQVYDKVIAEKFEFEKRLIVNELRKCGIQAILTTPEKLTVDTINKYLEIKARGAL